MREDSGDLTELQQDMQQKKLQKKKQKNTWQERIKICQDCDKYNKTWKICKECRCFMPLKTKIRWAACPLNKWN